jgi:hypothetical protein
METRHYEGLPEEGIYVIAGGAYYYCTDGLFRNPEPERLQRYRSLMAAQEEVLRLARAADTLLVELHGQRRPLAEVALGAPLEAKPEAWLYSVEQADFDEQETEHERN